MNHSLRKALALLMALLIAMPTFAFAEGPADETVVLDDSIEIIDEEQQVSSDAIEPPAEEAEALLLDDIASEYSDDAAGSETAAPEEASALVERVVSVDGVTFRVTSAAGAFSEDATLRVTPWEDAGIAEAVEAAFGAEGVYTHRQYRLGLLDSAENVILPSLEQGVPVVRVEGLNLPAGTRVAVYDEGMQGVYEIGAKVLSEDNAMLFDFVDAAVYDIFSGEEETVEEEPAGDEPAEESEEQEAEDVHPVEMVFDAMPDTAAVTVRPADAEEAVPAQADGSYLLLPGEYTYSAVADGFVSIEDVPFTVTGDEQPLRLSFALEPDIAEEYDAGVETTYIQRSWDGEKVVEETKYTSEQAQSVPEDGQMTSGFYYLDRDVTVDGRIELTGDTWLILGDGFTLDVKGLYIPEGSKLTIYGQGEEKGKLYSHPNGGGAAIGGYSGHDNGTIVIMGGTIVAEGDGNCAAIGSNDSRATGDITIFGGTITATGGDNGAGIGGGRKSHSGNITIYGGDITAKGGSDGAGIGCGEDGTVDKIEIYGGTVTGDNSDCENGAGIGGGNNCDGGTINIYGGTVTTWSRDGAGIGGGEDGQAGDITISGGDITCWDKGEANGARIGSGNEADNDNRDGKITITGGTIHTWHRDGAGIGGGQHANGGTIRISGGEIHASYAEGSKGWGAAIGGGFNRGEGGDITITGGVIWAIGNYDTAIGGGLAPKGVGLDGAQNSGWSGNITISGGEVHASSLRGYGIGAGGPYFDTAKCYEDDANAIGNAGKILITIRAASTAHAARRTLRSWRAAPCGPGMTRWRPGRPFHKPSTA